MSLPYFTRVRRRAHRADPTSTYPRRPLLRSLKAAFATQDFVGGTVNLIIALLAFVVAGSELPESLRNGGAPTPSGKPGRPTPTHFIDRPLHPYRLPPRRH